MKKGAKMLEENMIFQLLEQLHVLQNLQLKK